MVTLRRIGVVSAGRVGFWMGLATSFVNFVVILMFLVYNDIPVWEFPPEIWYQIGLQILISSIIMSFAVGMFAFLYNLNKNVFGGLKLEFEMPNNRDEKRKNNAFNDNDEDTTMV